MPPGQTTQPDSGSRTLTQTAAPARGNGSEANDAGPSEPVGVLKLRGGPSRRQKVVWSEETVDNEGMGKKKSKSGSSTQKLRDGAKLTNSNESESDCGHDHAPSRPTTKSRRKEDGGGAVEESSESEGGGGDGKAKPLKQVEDAKAVKEAEAAALAEKEAVPTAIDLEATSGSTANLFKQTDGAADWEDDGYVEKQTLQALVDRLNDKGDKEVTRVVKSIEYDRRLAATHPSLVIPESTREAILKEVLEDKQETTSPQQPLSEDQALLRIYVAYKVLQRLGFTVGRIEECLTKGIKETDNWEAAIEWMWLHLTEEECLAKGDFAAPTEPDWACDAPLQPPRTATPPPQNAAVVENRPASPSRGPLFRDALAEESGSGSDSDDEPDMDKANQTWAKLMLQLDALRSGSEIKKGGKKKGNNVVLETPEMRSIKTAMAKVEKEYMFSRKEADAIFKSLLAQARAKALEARLNGVSLGDPTEKPEVPDVTQTDDRDDKSDDSGDDLFGNMLDEPVAETGGTDQADDPNSTIQIRSMPIPKSFAFSGNIPKAMLKAALAKNSKPASVSYIKLSGYSRAVRVGLEISWSSERRRVWKMDELACEDLVEAENYVATLALSELSGRGEIGGVNWRVMPNEYRELWEELETKRSAQVEADKRDFWVKIRGIAGQQQSQSGLSAPQDKMGKAAAAVETAAPLSALVETQYSERLQADYLHRQATPAYQAMLPQRQSLPIASFRQQIIDTLETSQIVVLSGETGCGKSTQLPAYILEDQLSKGKACKVYVTEPRRISAISLAQRVSQELGERRGAVGSADSLVGYSIRMEAKISSNTRLAFVTNGIALRMLESGSAGRGTAFDQVTHIIVDEVHERSIDSDFLLIVLKQLVQQRPDLKVVLMSATLDADKISAFFGGCQTLSVPGRTFPVTVNHLEDAVELTGYHIDETSPYAVRSRFVKSGAKQLEINENGADSDASDSESEQNPAKLSSAKYSASTVSTVNLLDSRQIPYDLIVRLLETVCIERPEYQPFSAAILVFMPGLAEIRKLNELLQTHGHFGSAEYVIFPLHSTISSEGQGQVFDIPPRGVRKIVISTNIAETGVTIPDVTCVIDTGKHREMRYDERRQISRLVETYIAQDNAKQRRGRAGRVQEGLAFHLFTKARHDTQMARHAIPEMLRLSLQDLALRIKVLKVKLGSSIEDVLSRALDPPSSVNIQRAIASLVEVKALTTNEDITAMGRILSKLPMDVHLGKFIIVAAIFRCLDPALTIAATLNAKSPFITPFGFEAQADSAKKGFAVGNSDFLTIANVFASWRRASENPNYVRTFCKKNYLSHQNLQQIEELRQQLLSYLIDSSLVHVTPTQRQDIAQARYSRGNRTRFVPVPSEYDAHSENITILNAALAAGMYPKILTLNASGLQTITNQQPVSIHPSSINFRTSKADYGSNYLVYFTIMQSKKLYAWETGPVDDRALALFCGDNPDFKISATALQLDRNVKYHVHPRTAIALKALRQRMTGIMNATMRGKALDEDSAKWFNLTIKCLGSLSEEVAAPIGLLT